MVLLKKPSEGFKDNHASRCDAKFSLSLLNRHKLLRFGLFELFKIGSDLIFKVFFFFWLMLANSCRQELLLLI